MSTDVSTDRSHSATMETIANATSPSPPIDAPPMTWHTTNQAHKLLQVRGYKKLSKVSGEI